MVDFQSVVELLGDKSIHVDSSVVQTPDVDWIEPEIRLGVCAVRIDIVAVPAAVASEVDRVEVFHAQ